MRKKKKKKWMCECGWTSCLGEEEQEEILFFFLELYHKSSLGLSFVIITFLPIRQLSFVRN